MARLDARCTTVYSERRGDAVGFHYEGLTETLTIELFAYHTDPTLTRLALRHAAIQLLLEGDNIETGSWLRRDALNEGLVVLIEFPRGRVSQSGFQGLDSKRVPSRFRIGLNLGGRIVWRISPFPTLPIDFESLSFALFNFALSAFASLSSAGTAGSNLTRLGGPFMAELNDDS